MSTMRVPDRKKILLYSATKGEKTFNTNVLSFLNFFPNFQFAFLSIFYLLSFFLPGISPGAVIIFLIFNFFLLPQAFFMKRCKNQKVCVPDLAVEGKVLLVG